MGYSFPMKQPHKVSLVTSQTILSHRSKIALFSSAVPLVWEPLTLHRAALVLQHFPNSNSVLLSLHRADLPHRDRAHLPSSKEQGAKRPSGNYSSAAWWRSVLLVIIQCFSTGGNKVHVCGIWINKCKLPKQKAGDSLTRFCLFNPSFNSLYDADALIYSLIHNNALSFINPQFVEGFAE